MVFKICVLVEIDSTLGACPETKRREAKGALARSRKGCTRPLWQILDRAARSQRRADRPAAGPRTVRHKPNCNCDFNGFQKKHADCNKFVPWCVPRNTMARNQRGQPTGCWPHEPCVTNQMAFVTPIVFTRVMPTRPGEGRREASVHWDTRSTRTTRRDSGCQHCCQKRIRKPRNLTHIRLPLLQIKNQQTV